LSVSTSVLTCEREEATATVSRVSSAVASTTVSNAVSQDPINKNLSSTETSSESSENGAKDDLISADISKDALEDPFDPEKDLETDTSANEGQNMFRQKALSVQSDRLKKVKSLKTGKKNAEPRTAGPMAGKKETRCKVQE
jgi:hypothetical protein